MSDDPEYEKFLSIAKNGDEEITQAYLYQLAACHQQIDKQHQIELIRAAYDCRKLSGERNSHDR